MNQFPPLIDPRQICPYCQAPGHYLHLCTTLAVQHNLPAPYGYVCSNCQAIGKHYMQYCPLVTGVPTPPRPRIVGQGVTCTFCNRHGHALPICWNFARYYGLPAPYGWICRNCQAVGLHGADQCPNVQGKPLGAYVDGKYGKLIVFDLETTSLDRNSEILEVAACPLSSTKEMFQSYALPEGPIHPRASAVNKFTVENGELCFDGQALEAPTAAEALESFVAWLESVAGQNPILVAHNCRKFDASVLLHNMYTRADPQVRDRFLSLEVQFADSLPLCRTAFKGLQRYGLGDIYESIFGSRFKNAHEAKTDVTALIDILNDKNLQDVDFEPHMFTASDLAAEMKLR